MQDTGFVSCVPAVSSPVDVAKGLKKEARKFECPVCLVKRRDLPLHMRKIHFWGVAGSKSVISQFDLRKKGIKTNEIKDYHRSFICPVDNCHKVVKQHLRTHLRRVHYIVDSEALTLLMKSSKTDIRELIPDVVISSPKKNLGELNYKLICQKPTASVEEDDISKDMCVNEELNAKCTGEGWLRNINLPCYTEPVCDDSNESSSSKESSGSDYAGEDHSISAGNIDDALDLFAKYLAGPDRNVVPGSVAVTVNNVRRICVAVDASDLSSLILNYKDVIRDNYLNLFCKSAKTQLKAASIRTYLFSFIQFLKFIITEEIECDVPMEKVSAAIKAIEGWRKKYKPIEAVDRQKRRKVEQRCLITADDVSKYELGENAVNATQIFEKLRRAPNLKITMTEYVCIRDHLIVLCTFSSSN